jgi:hypothetical protein
MPHYPKKSFPTQQTFPCPVEGCRTQVGSHWGFTQHVGATHAGMDLQYPGDEGEFFQFPSSDIDQTSSRAPSLNAFSQDELDIHFNLNGDTESIPADLDSSESDLGDERSVPAYSTEFHPLINGTNISYIILQLLNEEL